MSLIWPQTALNLLENSEKGIKSAVFGLKLAFFG